MLSYILILKGSYTHFLLLFILTPSSQAVFLCDITAPPLPLQVFSYWLVPWANYLAVSQYHDEWWVTRTLALAAHLEGVQEQQLQPLLTQLPQVPQPPGLAATLTTAGRAQALVVALLLHLFFPGHSFPTGGWEQLLFFLFLLVESGQGPSYLQLLLQM